MYLWATLFSGTVVWLSIAKTQLFVRAVATAAAVLALLLMSMPRLRWWERRRRPGRPAPPASPQSASAQPALPQSASAQAAPLVSPQPAAVEARPRPGMTARPG